MYVRNVAGYNFSFMYRGAVMYIPYDGKIYSIPDDSGKYRELKTILPMNVRTQEVVYLRVDGKISDGQKRRGRPKGSTTKKSAKLPPKPKEDVVDEPIVDTDNKYTINVDLDALVNDSLNNVSNEKDTEVSEETPTEDVIETPKTTPKTTPKKSTTTKKKSTKKKASAKKKSTKKK